jgi:hypothetical protein
MIKKEKGERQVFAGITSLLIFNCISFGKSIADLIDFPFKLVENIESLKYSHITIKNTFKNLFSSLQRKLPDINIMHIMVLPSIQLSMKYFSEMLVIVSLFHFHFLLKE